MIFAAPWVLLALPALPLLWWLLRVTPPAPRSESFPAIRLLMGLHAREETPARTPWWLLLLRMVAATLVILALARPILDAGSTLAGSGPVLLVVDNGWASAGDWPRRMQAANTVLDRAERAGREVALLATAPDGSAAAPQATVPLPVADLRARVAALHPEAWPPDRAAAAKALLAWHQPDAAVVYLGDGLTHGGDFAQFGAALGEAGKVTELRSEAAPARLLLPPENQADRLVARVAQAPHQLPGKAVVLAQSGDGRTLARATLDLPAGASQANAAIVLPPELRNRLSRLVLEGPPTAASVVLLDERWRRRPVGVLAGDLATADTPFAGPLYYLHRALEPYTEVREADLATLLQRELSVLILADRPLPAGAERDALTKWVDQGGLLIRFAGPRTAEQPLGETDPLMPVKLLSGDRQLGGALSWAEPAGVAQFSATSPFAGLAVPDEVKVNRQVLAEPSADLTAHTWATLADGTPLVTQSTVGAGRVVLFHVTANADWSNLPLSGLFVDMLRRLVALSVGVAPISDNSVLAPAETLDGYGLLSPPPQAATGLPANEIARTPASPRHPPGLYGPENGRRALNLGTNLPLPQLAPPVAGARIEDYANAVPERALGPALLAAAVVL
ncbi:MAG: BatA domain-containing protein, partial [Acetobacteraceae bacterium]